MTTPRPGTVGRQCVTRASCWQAWRASCPSSRRQRCRRACRLEGGVPVVAAHPAPA